MRRVTVLYTILACIVVFYSCSRRPGNVLPEREMTDVLYDIQLAQAMMSSYIDPNYNNIEHKDALVKSVLDKYKITQADFDTSLVWYSDNMDIYMEINDTISARLRSKAQVIRDKMAEQNKTDDALRNRLLPMRFYLTAEEPTLSFNVDSFKIKTMDMKHFKLLFDVQGLSLNDHVSAALFFTYKDTSIQKMITLEDNTRYLIDKPLVPDSLLSGVSGFIHLRHSSQPSRVLLYNIQYQDSISNEVETASSLPNVRDNRLRQAKDLPSPAKEIEKSEVK